MIKKIKLTEEHIKLIPFFYLQEVGDDEIVVNKKHLYELGSHLMEDLAIILGKNDTAIAGTENNANGRAYPEEVEKELTEIHKYITDNLFDIETIIHQFAIKGGITPGTYKAKDNELIWEKES
jgi:hypothetical protein